MKLEQENGWVLTTKKNFSCKNPVFIEGLPGVANVGKIVVDYMIDLLGAKKIGSIVGNDLPNSVFVMPNGLVHLPVVELFHYNHKGRDFIFLSGDAQPTDSSSTYGFTRVVLDFLEDVSCSEIVTLGGVGLPEEPKDPSIYAAGNNKKFMSEFKPYGVKTNSFGVVGPIIGVSGLLVGLAKERKIKAAALLCESLSHPLYVGLREAKQLLKVITKKYGLKVDSSFLDDEIKSVENEVRSLMDQTTGSKKKSRSKVKSKSPRVAKIISSETSYIG